MKFMLSSWGELESVQQPLQACQTAPEAESTGRRASKPVTEGEMHRHSLSLSLALTDPPQPQQTAEPAIRDADKCVVGGSPGTSLPSYLPTSISITCAVWTNGATSLWKQLWEKRSVGDLEVLGRKGTRKWSPRSLPVFLILVIHFSLATWSRPVHYLAATADSSEGEA